MNEINRVLFQALAVALGLDPAARQTSQMIRQAWVNPAPPPPPPGQDVIYYHLVPDGSPPWRETDTDADGSPCLFLFTRYRMNLVCYGPNAERLAWRIYHGIFSDGYGKARALLRSQRIYPIPRPQPPVSLWEEWEKQRRLRADLTLRLSIAQAEMEIPPDTGAVEAAPEILIDPSSSQYGV